MLVSHLRYRQLQKGKQCQGALKAGWFVRESEAGARVRTNRRAVPSAQRVIPQEPSEAHRAGQ